MGQAYYDHENGSILQKMFAEQSQEKLDQAMADFKEKMETFNPEAELIAEVEGATEEITREQLDEVVREFLKNQGKP